jgi:branched-chain amino acid transport system ATP-binding protein
LAKPEPLLLVKDIHTYYDESYILQGVSLDLYLGQIVAILGRNGMGKTTLIRSVAGLTPPRRGEIEFKGQSLKNLAPYRIAQKGMALVPQGRRIFTSLSVKENLLIPTSSLAGKRNHKNSNGNGKHWDLAAVLEEFPQLADREKNFGGDLSGGEQQMLAIGRALMANPELILMDEPSEGLSPRLVQQIGQIMSNLKKQGHSILLVEQNFDLAMNVADYVHVLSAGKIVFSGTPDHLSSESDILDKYLGCGGESPVCEI